MTDKKRADSEIRDIWVSSFRDQMRLGAYNTTAAEALVRTVSYFLRARFSQAEYARLKFLEAGCGAGPNLIWLAEKGIRVSGIDISPNALELSQANFKAHGLEAMVDDLREGSVVSLPYEDQSFDGVIESCVYQHLNKEERKAAFSEVARVLKPGGVFVGYQLAEDHSLFQQRKKDQFPDDPGTVSLDDNGDGKVGLNTIGLSHFFAREEYADLMKAFSVVEPLLVTYEVPSEEATRRGYESWTQAMWNVFGIR